MKREQVAKLTPMARAVKEALRNWGPSPVAPPPVQIKVRRG